MKKKIDLELYLNNELSAWFECKNKDLDYGVWIIKRLAVMYTQMNKASEFDNLNNILDSLYKQFENKKIIDDLDQYLSELKDLSFCNHVSFENLLSEMQECGEFDLDDPEEFFQNALDFTSMTCGFMSDEYLTLLEYFVQIMIRLEKYYQMIDFIDCLLSQVESEKLGMDFQFILMGYKVSLYLGIDLESAYQIEKERIKICEDNLIKHGETELLAREISTFMQILSMNKNKDDFFSLLSHYLNSKIFNDEELLFLLDGVCLSFDMHQYSTEIEVLISPCVERICNNNAVDSDIYLTARRFLINFYSLTHDLDKVEKYLREDLLPTERLYGKKSNEYRCLIDCALTLSRDRNHADECLRCINLIRNNGWADEDKAYSTILVLYEAESYFAKGQYQKARRLGLLSMFQFMLLFDEDQSTQWVEALELVARSERANGDVESSRKHYENVLEAALRIFGPEDSFVVMVTEELESF